MIKSRIISYRHWINKYIHQINNTEIDLTTEYFLHFSSWYLAVVLDRLPPVATHCGKCYQCLAVSITWLARFRCKRNTQHSNCCEQLQWKSSWLQHSTTWLIYKLLTVIQNTNSTSTYIFKNNFFRCAHQLQLTSTEEFVCRDASLKYFIWNILKCYVLKG